MACDGFGSAPVTVFCDGARTESDKVAIAATLEVARNELGSSADIRPAERNLGIYRSITTGVSDLISVHGRAIAIEDDLELANSFLSYMNTALEAYATDERVFQVTGYAFDVPKFKSRDTAVLMPFTSSLGWATWGRAWATFDHAATGWQDVIKNHKLRNQFNLGGSYDYATALRRQMTENPQHWDWDIRWYLSVFRANGLTVSPPRSLVRHTGFDGSGTHGTAFFRKYVNHSVSAVLAPNSFLTPACDPTDVDLQAVKKTLWWRNGGWTGWTIDFAKRLLRR